jgi:hypothetical protein
MSSSSRPQALVQLAHPRCPSVLVPLLHARVAVVQHAVYTLQQWLQVLAQAGVAFGELAHTLQQGQQSLQQESNC